MVESNLPTHGRLRQHKKTGGAHSAHRSRPIRPANRGTVRVCPRHRLSTHSRPTAPDVLEPDVVVVGVVVSEVQASVVRLTFNVVVSVPNRHRRGNTVRPPV